MVSASFGLDNTNIPSLRASTTSSLGGNVTTFLNLTDTPSSYSGDGDKCVTVKNDETGLEFISCPGGGSGITNISQAGDVDVTGIDDNDVLRWDDAVKKWVDSKLNAILSFGSNYLFFSGDNEISFNETRLNETGDNRYVNIDGDNMTGDLNMSDNNITDVNCITLSNGQPMCWNVDAFTLDIPTGAGNTIQVGQELTLMRKNKAGKIIYAGQIVYDSGSQGERITVKLADASDGDKIHNLGMVTIEYCNTNADCPITYFGDIHDLDTGSFSEGDSLYLSDDGSGNFTTTIPGGLNYSLNIGTVSRNHSSTGIINFQPEIDYGDDPLFMDLRIVNDLIVNNNITSGWFNGLFNWVTGDNWNTFDGATLIFNETRLNNTIDSKISSIEYNASVINTFTGTLDSGDLSDILIRDNIFYNVSEVTGTTGFNIQINYTKVVSFERIVARLNYEGSPTHNVVIELFDCVSGLYEIEEKFIDTDVIADILHEVLDPADHICGLDQNVSLQIRHTSSGNPSHDIFIDGVHLVKGVTSASPTEIDPSSIHKSGDVTLTDNWNAGDFNITTSWFNGLFNWTTLTNWLSFDGTTLSFNETKLNQTIDDRSGGNVNFTNVAFINETNTFAKNQVFNKNITLANSESKIKNSDGSLLMYIENGVMVVEG